MAEGLANKSLEELKREITCGLPGKLYRAKASALQPLLLQGVYCSACPLGWRRQAFLLPEVSERSRPSGRAV